MKLYHLTAAVLTAALLAGCAPWSVCERPLLGSGANSEAASGDSAYIRSNGKTCPKYGCSFIEFDGKGGFLDYPQLQHAEDVLKERAASSDVLLVIYCHGWNNNAESGDVIQFVSFLRRLAIAKAAEKRNVRVEGVYLSWRGSQYVPVLGQKAQMSDPGLYADFNQQDLDNPKWSTPPFPGDALYPLEFASYFSIKDRAEHNVATPEFARALFDLAFTLKSPEQAALGRHHYVFVLGHSFGALLLEQSLGSSSVGLLASQWSTSGNQQDRWPFDLVVFLNSAAPSLYAKQLQDCLTDDRRSTFKPRIVSITSTGDWATGTIHEIGNLGNRYFAADLQRQYHPYGSGNHPVTAGYYYDFTPGHNKYLINGCIYKDKSPVPPNIGTNFNDVFTYNLINAGPKGTFYATSVRDGEIYGFGLSPAAAYMPSNYWILTLPPEIIPWHTQIWSPSSMEMLAGIFSIVQSIPPGQKAYVNPYKN